MHLYLSQFFYRFSLLALLFVLGGFSPTVYSAKLINISARSLSGTSLESAIAGFIIEGTGSCDVMIRGFGKGLGLSNLNSQLLLQTYPNGNILKTNQSWQIGNDVNSIPQALHLPDPSDAGIYVRLQAGAYTATMTPEGETGIGLIGVDEVSCDIDTKLINISTRAKDKTGAEAIIAGFIITGSGTLKVMIRGFGKGIGLSPCLNTKIQVQKFPSGEEIASNDNWGNATNASEIPTNFKLPDATDAGLLIELPAGAYTATMTPEAGSCDGIGLIGVDAIQSGWSKWYRPVDNPVFTTDYGNNHDSIIFFEPDLEYPYHLIVSHEPNIANLWRAKTFSWSSSDWELVSDNYQIANQYEFDDGVKVDGTYYIFEEGEVYTYSGALEDGSGLWVKAGSFPYESCNDIGVYYEDGVFHIFGEYGYFPHGPDGISLSHYVSATGLGDWTLVDTKAVDPNPDGGSTFGVGDPTIAKIDGTYYIYSDLESVGHPYRVIAWQSSNLYSKFEYIDVAIAPRSDQVDDWDNYRVQDCDIAFVPELSRSIMTCNMMDVDGNPGGNFPTLPGFSRVIGVFYSDRTLTMDMFESGAVH